MSNIGPHRIAAPYIETGINGRPTFNQAFQRWLDEIEAGRRQVATVFEQGGVSPVGPPPSPLVYLTSSVSALIPVLGETPDVFAPVAVAEDAACIITPVSDISPVPQEFSPV